jgi:hypothetical protein
VSGDAERAELEARLARLEAENTRLRVAAAYARLGIRTEAAPVVVELVDWSRVRDINDDAELEHHLTRLAREHPYLRRPRGEAIARPLDDGDDERADNGQPAPWRPWQAPPGVY